MAKFQCNIADPKKGVAYNVEISDKQAVSFLIGKKVGQTIDADPLGLPEYELKITGGSDEDGCPMNPNMSGGIRRKILSKGTVGIRRTDRGQKVRKNVRGNTITEDIYQLNLKITEYGSTSIDELLAKLVEE